jgi:large subunit ribosomal protein L29
MKKNELNDMTVSELEVKLKDDLDSLQNFRFQKALQQLEDPSQLRNVKKEIAQLKTVLREYDLGIRNDKKMKEQ